MGIQLMLKTYFKKKIYDSVCLRGTFRFVIFQRPVTFPKSIKKFIKSADLNGNKRQIETKINISKTAFKPQFNDFNSIFL
jgi:hypothetical protein